MFKKYKWLISFFCLIFIDLLAYYTSLFLAYFFRVYVISFFFRNYPYVGVKLIELLKMFWIPIVFIFTIFVERLYTLRYPFWEESKIIFKSICFAILFVFLTINIRNLVGVYSRLIFLFLWLFSSFIFILFRFWGKQILYKMGIWKEDVFFIGGFSDLGKESIKGLSRDNHLGYNIIGLLEKDENLLGKELEVEGKIYKVLGLVKDFERLNKENNIKTLVIETTQITEKELEKITSLTKSVLLIPEIKGVSILNTELHFLFMEYLYLFQVNNNLNSITNRIMKRLFDLSLSLLLLPFLLIIIIILAILIKIDSKGPIFFIQKRLGKKGKIFNCLKFRTMKINSDEILQEFLDKNPDAKKEWETYKKLKSIDPRITRIGRFLRKFSLDELPQIFNVLVGDMSLVGPRPYMITEEEDLKNYKEVILFAQPGITGLWQISGRNELDFDSRVKLDAWYVQNWTLWLDIIIIFKTIKVVLLRQGAY